MEEQLIDFKHDIFVQVLILSEREWKFLKIYYIVLSTTLLPVDRIVSVDDNLLNDAKCLLHNIEVGR